MLDFVENRVFAAARPKGQEGGLGREVKLREAVESARPHVEGSFHDQPLIEARLCMTIGKSFQYLGDAKAAEALYLRARELYTAKLGPDHPDTLASMNNLANSYDDLGRHPEALKLREETLRLQKAKLGPDHPDTLGSMWSLAESLIELNRDEEALPIIEDCLKRAAGRVVNSGLVSDAMGLRVRVFQKKKDPAGCLETAAKWEALQRTDADSLYNAACFRAICAAVIKGAARDEGQGAREQADLALAWLKKAVAAGFKNAQHMKKHADLDALRDRDDFKKLMTDLEKKQKESGSRKQESADKPMLN